MTKPGSNALTLATLGAGLLAACLMVVAPAANAAKAADDGACGLRVATGPAGKVYEQLFADMNAVCGDETKLCPVPSEGGMQNLTLLSTSRADIGLVQIDTLEAMKEGDDNLGRLQAVIPLHANLLHVVTLGAGSTVGTTQLLGRTVPGTGHKLVIANFSQLKGRTIAAVGSAQLMGPMLDRRLHYGLVFENADSDEQALAWLRAGKVEAVFTTVGWPSPVIARQHDGSVMLARFDVDMPAPYRVVKRNYQNLGQFNLPFLSVPNLLVTNPYKPGGDYFKRVATLQRCLVRHLDELQEGGHHPAWKEVTDPTQSLGITLFEGAAAEPAGPSSKRRK